MEPSSVPDNEDSEDTLDLTELHPDAEDKVDATLQDVQGTSSPQVTETRVVAESSSGGYAPAEEHVSLQEQAASTLSERQEDSHAPTRTGGQGENKEKRMSRSMSRLAERLSHLQEDLHASKPPGGEEGNLADASSKQAMYNRVKRRQSLDVTGQRFKALEDRLLQQQEELAAQKAEVERKHMVLEDRLAKQEGNLDARIAGIENLSAQQQLQLEALNANVEKRVANEKHVANETAGLDAHKASTEKESSAHVEGLEKHLRDLERNLAELQENVDACTVEMESHATKQQTELQVLEKRWAEQRAKDSSEQAEGSKKQLADLEQIFSTHLQSMEKHPAEQQPEIQEVSSSRDQQGGERLEELRQECRREEAALLDKIKMIETSLRKFRDDQEGLLRDVVPTLQAKVKKIDSSLQRCCDDQNALIGDTVPAIQAKVKKMESSLRRCCDDQAGLLEDTVPAVQAKVSRIESSLQRCCGDQESLLDETIPAMQAEAKEMRNCLKDFGSLQDEMIYDKLPGIETQLKLQVVKRLTSQKAVLEEQANILWKKFETSMDEREKESWTRLETMVDTHHQERLVQLETTIDKKQVERCMELETSLAKLESSLNPSLAKLESSLNRQKQELVKFEIALESREEEVAKDETEQKPAIPGLAIGSMQQSVADLQPMVTGAERQQGLPSRQRGGNSTPSSTPREPRSQHLAQHGSSTPRGGTMLREPRAQHRSHSAGALQRRTMHIDVVTPQGVVPPAFSPASMLTRKNNLCRRHPCWHDCHFCRLGTKTSAFDDPPMSLTA